MGEMSEIKIISFFGFPGFDPPPLEKKFTHLTPQQKLILFGADGAAGDVNRWKPLWESEPENKAYLVEYAMAHYREHQGLSPEILATAQTADPENAWFPALAASGIAEKAVSKERVPYSGRKVPAATPVWKIDDEPGLNKVLAAIHSLTGKSRFASYRKDLLAERMRMLPSRTDFVKQSQLLGYAYSQPSSTIQFRKLGDVLSAGAQQCALNGDVDGFRQITGDWRILSGYMVGNASTLIDGLVAKNIIFGPLQNFRDAAKSLGLDKDAVFFSELHDRFQRDKDAREKRHKYHGAAAKLSEAIRPICSGDGFVDWKAGHVTTTTD